MRGEDNMKLKKKMFSLLIATTIAFTLSVPALAVERNMNGEPVDRSGEVTRVDIPHKDGTVTTLEGAEAQAWYEQAVLEGKQRAKEEKALAVAEEEVEVRGPFHYRYRYLESNFTPDVERTELEKTVTNKLRNSSSTDQSYQLSLNVSQSWSVSPSVSGEYKDAIKGQLGGSWGKSYSKNETFTVKIPSNKTLWVTFIPIMDKSEGQAQKYFIPRGGLSDKPFVEESHDVVTYNPQYLTTKMGPFTIKTVYGIYVWHEQ